MKFLNWFIYHFEHNLKIAYEISVPCKLKLLWLLPVWFHHLKIMLKGSLLLLIITSYLEFNWINQSASDTMMKDEGAVVSSFQKLTI